MHQKFRNKVLYYLLHQILNKEGSFNGLTPVGHCKTIAESLQVESDLDMALLHYNKGKGSHSVCCKISEVLKDG